MDEFARAVARLQGYAHRAAPRSHYLTERYDEALNDMLRNPDRPGDANELVDVALNNGRKKLERRAPRTPRPASDALDGLSELGVAGVADAPPVPDQMPDWYCQLRPRSQRLIVLAALGFSAREVSELTGLSPGHARVALLRARTEARRLLEAA